MSEPRKSPTSASMRKRRPPGQRRREFSALILSFLLTLAIGRIIVPPHSHGPAWLATLVYVLLYVSSYMAFWWIGGLGVRR
jgi:hypothetical protein